MQLSVSWSYGRGESWGCTVGESKVGGQLAGEKMGRWAHLGDRGAGDGGGHVAEELCVLVMVGFVLPLELAAHGK